MADHLSPALPTAVRLTRYTETEQREILGDSADPFGVAYTGLTRLPKPESADDLELKSAFAQFSGHFEPLRVFTSWVKIDYRPKSRLTWGNADIPPWSSVDSG